MAEAKAPAAKKAAPKAAKAAKAAKPAAAPKAKKTSTKTAAKKVESNIVKKTDSFVILKKRSGRYAVKASNHKWIKGEEKVKILLAEGLIKAPLKKKEAAAE